MQILQQKAKELLESGRVQVIIGFGSGTEGRDRAVFIRDSANVDKLILNENCKQNLAVYLNKIEIKRMGTAAIVVTPMIAKTLVQMIAEKQISLPSFIPIAVDDGTVIELTTNSVLEDYVTNHPVELPPQVKDIMDKLEAMSVDERFQYWRDELTRCFKCYACRAACPLCYCDRCITDCNQPQWINYSPHTQGNYEWHINRAMHLAGRCIECGACGRACPLDIPIHLLTIKASHIAINEFDYIPGIKCDTPSALSSFKVEDQENFIK